MRGWENGSSEREISRDTVSSSGSKGVGRGKGYMMAQRGTCRKKSNGQEQSKKKNGI